MDEFCDYHEVTMYVDTPSGVFIKHHEIPARAYALSPFAVLVNMVHQMQATIDRYRADFNPGLPTDSLTWSAKTVYGQAC